MLQNLPALRRNNCRHAMASAPSASDSPYQLMSHQDLPVLGSQLAYPLCVPTGQKVDI